MKLAVGDRSVAAEVAGGVVARIEGHHHHNQLAAWNIFDRVPEGEGAKVVRLNEGLPI